jgi:hypothetical protein
MGHSRRSEYLIIIIKLRPDRAMPAALSNGKSLDLSRAEGSHDKELIRAA